MNFAIRSYEKELLDFDDLPFDDVKKNMQELNFINTWLGGHAITIDGFKKLAGEKKQVSVCEIGCGGGDNLLAIERWCNSQNINVQVSGIDLKPACIDFAYSKQAFKSKPNFIISDYRDVDFKSKPDIIFSSLFCHHFSNEQLIEQFKWMKANSTVGFFINDLHRHPLAYYAIKVLTKLFSSSYLVKNDAPLSVARGFKKRELAALLMAAGIFETSIAWKWAFRYLIVYKHA